MADPGHPRFTDLRDWLPGIAEAGAGVASETFRTPGTPPPKPPRLATTPSPSRSPSPDSPNPRSPTWPPPLSPLRTFSADRPEAPATRLPGP